MALSEPLNGRQRSLLAEELLDERQPPFVGRLVYESKRGGNWYE
jgi:hypothetical protein